MASDAPHRVGAPQGQTSLSLLSFNSEQQLKETKTELTRNQLEYSATKSRKHSEYFVKYTYLLSYQELYENIDIVLMFVG